MPTATVSMASPLLGIINDSTSPSAAIARIGLCSQTRRRARRSVWLFAFAALLLEQSALPRIARACSGPAPGIEGRTVFAGAVAPTNVQPAVDYHLWPQFPGRKARQAGLAENLQLWRDGAPVEADVDSSAQAVRIRPRAPLAVGASYQLVDRWSLPCQVGNNVCRPGDWNVIASFMVAAGVDTRPPVFSGVRQVDLRKAYEAGGSCDPSGSYEVTFRWLLADDESQEPTLYNLYRVQGAELVLHEGLIAGSFYRDHVLCGARTAERGLLPGPYVVRAVDRAGNEDDNLSVITVANLCERSVSSGGSLDSGVDGAVDAGPSSPRAGGCSLAADRDAPSGAVLFAFALLAFGFIAQSRAVRGSCRQ